MVRISGQQGVPVTTVDGQTIVGYDQAALEQLLSKARRPHLGAAVADVRGVYVGRVTPGSVAAQGGLQAGDIILRVGDQVMTHTGDLERVLAKLTSGQAIILSYLRAGQEHRTSILF